MTLAITRRATLAGLFAPLLTAPGMSAAFAAAATSRRFVVILLRGGLDGLHAVPPHADPGLAAARSRLAVPPPGAEGGALPLDGHFGLHPALAGLHGLYGERLLTVFHAVGGFSPERSHFIAQDCLECGAGERLSSGWLNRLAAALPQKPGGAQTALAVGVSLPLLLRGPASVGSFLPQGAQRPPADLYAQVLALHRTDPVTGPALAAGMAERDYAAGVIGADDSKDTATRFSFANLALSAGKLLAAPDGPRLAALELGGWDTHAAQANRLTQPLKSLDAGILALRTGLGAAWNQTVVLIATEFGRTVRENGTNGTDHGTGMAAFLAGGAVQGGSVLADWPGLGEKDLHEARDLRPTTSLRAITRTVLAEHYGLNAATLADILPGSERDKLLKALVRA